MVVGGVWHVLKVLESVVDRFYKGLLNARLRQQKETEEKSDLLANRDNIRCGTCKPSPKQNCRIDSSNQPRVMLVVYIYIIGMLWRRSTLTS